MLRCLLQEGEGFMKIDHHPTQDRLTMRIDRERIADVGKPVLGTMLLRLHMYRATANVENYQNIARTCRE
jgi:dipeptidyl-peptidase-3